MLTLLLFVARAFISGGFQAAYVYTPEVGRVCGNSRVRDGGRPETPSLGSFVGNLSLGLSDSSEALPYFRLSFNIYIFLLVKAYVQCKSSKCYRAV